MNNIYGNFIWWQGVVEDKMDPLMLGRCRVRILGYHTDDKQEIPTKDLPWATIMQPTTSAAISGVGTTPLGPVEGTWVVGFFRDGEDSQEPIIMGTIGGIPQEGADPQKGFNDPGLGPFQYPKDEYLPNPNRELRDGSVELKGAEPDTNRLARGNKEIPTQDISVITNDGVPLSHGENAQSLIWKRKTRQEGVPKALAGDLSSSISDTSDPFYMGDVIDEDVDNFNYYWNEPHPRYGGVKKSKTDFATTNSSCYPYNHVRESESGHIEEWDDTIGAERLHRYHKSGTFEEIQADGTRVVKVVGDDYEIVAGEKNVLVSGDCNITVEGNCRLKTVGSLVQEVTGNYHLNVLGDMRVKVGGNMVQEIMSARKIKVEKDDDLKVGKSKVVNVGINAEYQVGKDFSNSAGSTWTATSIDVGILATSGVFISGTATCDLLAAKVGIGSSLLTAIESDLAITITAATELITITGPITETCAIKTSTAVGMWNRVGATILDTAIAHNCIDSAIFNVKAPLILLN